MNPEWLPVAACKETNSGKSRRERGQTGAKLNLCRARIKEQSVFFMFGNHKASRVRALRALVAWV